MINEEGNKKMKSIKILNVGALIMNIKHFEKSCRLALKNLTKNGVESAEDNYEVYREWKYKNEKEFKRFISCNFSTNYEACKVDK